jgi:hypothetical protein
MHFSIMAGDAPRRSSSALRGSVVASLATLAFLSTGARPAAADGQTPPQPGAPAAPAAPAPVTQPPAEAAASAAPPPVYPVPVYPAQPAYPQPVFIQPAAPPLYPQPTPIDLEMPRFVVTETDEAPAHLSDFMDTRLAWTFGNDDVLHAVGEATPLSPSASIGDRPQYRLFFDNLNSRFNDRENITHLVLYKKMPGYIRNLDTEASLALRLDMSALATNTNNLNQALYDAGSFIRLFYHTEGGPSGKRGIGLTLWPIDTDRFRLGYLYDISWGGSASSINQSIFPNIQGGAPGAKLQYDGDGWNAFFGFKTAQIVQLQQTLTPGTSDVQELHLTNTNYGFLGGMATDPSRNLHIDVNGGFFQQGKFDLPDVAGRSVYTFGASGRIIVHKDMPVPQSIDFLLYRNDPNKPMVIFKPEVYTPGKTSWAGSLEFTELAQNLKDFDTVGVTTLQAARAAALQLSVKSGFFRGSLTGIYRDLAFVLRNQPSFIPFETLPKESGSNPEEFFAGTIDYYLERLRLTPGLGAGLQFPATFSSTSVNTNSAPIERVVVVRQQGNLAILPVNQQATPIFQARLSLKWQASKILSAQVWVQYIRDNNGTFVEQDPTEGTVSLRTFINPDFFGLGTSVMARF